MRKTFTALCILTSLAGISAIQKEDGRAGATGSPGETTCNTSQCHVGNVVNNGAGSVVIDVPAMVNWQYIPGQVYPISVTVSKSNTPLFGFGFEALRSTGANGGVFTITNSAETQLKTAIVGGNIRTNVVHQLDGGLTPNSHTFTFNWTAPATGTGPVTFYAAGNAANNNGTASGDFIYTTSQPITEFLSGLDELKSVSRAHVFPNPAVDNFKIEFSIIETAVVTMKLLDLSGKTVREITSGTYSQGDHSIQQINGNDLKPGIYFVQMEINSDRLAKKIVVL